MTEIKKTVMICAKHKQKISKGMQCSKDKRCKDFLIISEEEYNNSIDKKTETPDINDESFWEMK